MTFYIHPPSGDLHLHDLSAWCLQRMTFLMDVYRCRGSTMQMRDLVDNLTTECECLIEGSKKDATSHFTLRLMCCDDPELRDVFIQSEISFFKFRFSCFLRSEIQSSLKPLKKYHAELRLSKNLSEQEREILTLLDAITAQNDWRSLVKAYTQSNSGFIRVPFRFVCNMVAKRSVVLQKGTALVPCCKLSEVMAVVFSLLLTEGMRVARCSRVEADSRMRRLYHTVRRKFLPVNNNENSVHNSISCDDISSLSEFFPLCMSMKLQTLQVDHRLRHHSRIQLTLFLKELGLPLNEALHFWRQEYSQPGPRHSWKDEERRYTYNIRHLYGLEGSRRNYRSHCCESLQIETNFTIK
ncbi:hypothetical protein CAPTEDRAFT_208161 [Capitella teleta]|uniref:DNA primase large subunit C-terminal domain-containing protein n=1 Tax=Capitella teleta TaxID=283909 RepID=R7UXH4_CAPTE|nr:hypothetical protein CAPTEDRAFT_208161 [Capitella teleta]|eukprot:ELU11283.1 hypothetical protein CAPTEDRAFT_208161 [Capitella teleta]